MRHLRAEAGVKAGELGAFGGFHQELAGHVGQFVNGAASSVLQFKREARGIAVSGQRRRAEREDPRFRHLGELNHEFAQDAFDVCLAGGSLVPVFQADEESEAIGGRDAGHDTEAGDVEKGTDAFCLVKDGFDFFADGLGALQRGGVGQFAGDEKVTFVLVRNKPTGDLLPENENADHGGHQQQHGAGRPADQESHHPRVTRREGIKTFVEPAEKDAQRPALWLGRTQQHRRQRRTQRQRVDRRKNHRGRNRDRKLLIERARQSRHKSDRHKNRTENQRNRHHRAGYFLHGPLRRLHRRVTMLKMMHHRLHHHNRIIDHNANRQYQPK